MIQIRDFHKGQSSSLYLTDGAYSKSANLDVFSQPGIARINYKPLKKSDDSGGNEVTELITSFARNPDPLATAWYSPDRNGVNYNDWVNPDNAHAKNSYATCDACGGGAMKQGYSRFNIVVPDGATITGIEVQLKIKVSSGTQYMAVYLTKDLANFTEFRSIPVTTSDTSYVSAGGSTDMWGTTWTSTETNLDAFGVMIYCSSTAVEYSLDHIQIKVYFEGDTIFAAGESGTIWQSADSGDSWTVLSTSKGKYLAVWKGYLVSALNSYLYFYNIAEESWENFYHPTPLNSTSEHFMLVSENDGNLYICDKHSVASLIEVLGQTFDPTTSATMTFNAQSAGTAHLTLYKPFRAICLAEQRENLVVGAIDGFSSTPKMSSSIFIWDRLAEKFEFPVFLSGEFVTGLVNVQNTVYIVTDYFGKVYQFSESGLSLVKEIPFDSGSGNIRIGNKGHSSVAFWRNKVMLGVSSDDGLSVAGIYGLKGKAINREHLISTGEDGSNDDVDIGAIYPLDSNTLLYGWYDKQNSKYGIDKIATSYNRVGSYGSYFESIFYPLGSKLKNTSFARVEVQLSRPLQTGEGVRIKYRRDINGSWTTLGTRDFSTDGAQSSLHFNGIKNIENLQIRCEMTTGSTTNTPYINAVYLI